VQAGSEAVQLVDGKLSGVVCVGVATDQIRHSVTGSSTRRGGLGDACVHSREQAEQSKQRATHHRKALRNR
jgi:hypothetical protein